MARSRLGQRTGPPRPAPPCVALHEARGQPRAKAHRAGGPHRNLGAGGRATKPLGHLDLAERARGPRHLCPGRGLSSYPAPPRAAPARGVVGCHLGPHASSLTGASRHRPESFGPGVVLAPSAPSASAPQQPYAGLATFIDGRSMGGAPWVGVVTGRTPGAAPTWGATLRPPSLRLARLLLWWMRESARHYRLFRQILVDHDLDEKVQAFGIVFNY